MKRGHRERHARVSGNALRAGVLGANDGLVSNLSLVMGVAGAAFSNTAILVSGLAGLLAGAGSMALGEWISVQSSRELAAAELALEEREIAEKPEEETRELERIYRSRGVPAEEARRLAVVMMSEGRTALETHAREELGIDPASLGGSAWTAAWTSFLLFAAGAIVPVAPFLFLGGRAAILTSVGLSAVALFTLGAGISLLTGRGGVRTGARQLALGLAAAALTFGVGRLLGVAVS